ncbi:alpha/beta fold hydrolase [Stackebrandtia soli]|uniref:alpha/beta fold hydrolase n=1 Tax=Stackebrandtia soli TaxID=1892856 RepID=UPI0039E8A44B
MNRARSTDGTLIAFEAVGDGPTVVLVGGGLDDGAENAPLIPALTAHGFRVVNYARRGRADSGDADLYSVEREIDDLAAVIVETGGRAHLFGASSGGALALEASAAGVPVDRLAVYEVPYALTDEAVGAFRAYVGELSAALSSGRPDTAVELFMRLAGAPEPDVAVARSSPEWPRLTALAPTLAYDAACLGDGRPPMERLARVTCPTLVLTGGAVDPHTGDLHPSFFDNAADAITHAVSDAERRTLAGQTHVADPVALAPELVDFFTRPHDPVGERPSSSDPG